MKSNKTKIIKNTVISLIEEINSGKVSRISPRNYSMPSLQTLRQIMDKLKSILFPGYLSEISVKNNLLGSFLEIEVESIKELLHEQVRRGYCYECEMLNKTDKECQVCQLKAEDISLEFVNLLPKIKHLLNKDVIAAYNGDPAAKNYGEVVYCYPVINALIHYRVAHELLKLGVPLIPRIISEMSHSATGIDIHPGATIGEYFTIDHGTGVVIGETTIIGNNVKIYQGVTLGAKSFPLDKEGKPVKGIPRHPIVEDNVVIYANATILGRICIGKDSVIGANVWVTEDVSPKTKLHNLKKNK